MTILLCVLLAYICRMLRPESHLLRTLADQLRTCLYLGIYCAWVIYLNKHVVHKSMRQYLTAIGCMMVFWFFLRTIKYHIFQDPLGGHICWYLYYVPMILIPTLGLTATLLMEEREEKRIKKISTALLLPAAVLIVCVLTNDLHQQVFCFLMEPPYSDENYHYGKIFFVKFRKPLRTFFQHFRYNVPIFFIPLHQISERYENLISKQHLLTRKK